MKILPKGSDSWNVMVKCHHIEINFLTLDVGTSEDVLFWEESWDGHPLIDNNLFHVSLNDKLSNYYGKKVCEYRIK